MVNKYKQTAASVLVKTGAGSVAGIIIASHTSGTIKLWDNTSAATTVLLDTTTLAVGERFISLENVAFNTGLYITIGGTANVTVIYD